MKSDRLPKNNQLLVYRTGRGMPDWVYFQLTHSAHCSAHSPDLPADLIHSEGFNYHRMQKMRHLWPLSRPSTSCQLPPNHPTNIIHLLKSITIHQVTQLSLTQHVPLSHRKSFATYRFSVPHYYFSESSFFTELLDQGFIHLNDFLPVCLNPSFLLSFYPFPSQHLFKRRI